MGLFGQLLRLHPDYVPSEDFFTEITAHLFQRSPKILFSWLRRLRLDGLPDEQDLEVHVSTQVRVEDVRFDILVELVHDNWHAWIVIESKMDSPESNDQLHHYVEILDRKKNLDLKVLLYVTRHYDPKNEYEIFRDVDQPSVRFVQTRWHGLYPVLTDTSQDSLVDEIKTFMEEKHMTRPSRFTPEHITSLLNMSDLINLLDETMDESVHNKIRTVIGRGGLVAIGDIKRNSRYESLIHVGNGFHFLLDYSMRSSKEGNYPIVLVELAIDAKSRQRDTVNEAFRQIANRPGWGGWGLSNSVGWAGVSAARGLEKFLSEENHAEAIRAYFLGLLDEMAEIKRTYPDLPW